MPNELTRLQDVSNCPAVCHLKIKRSFKPKSPRTGSGILIGPRHVLTAAHNAVEWRWNRVLYTDIRAGLASVSDSDLSIRVERSFIPSRYQKWYGKTTFTHDYAVLRLSEAVELEEYPRLSETIPVKGDEVRVIGYPGDEDENPDFSGYDLFSGIGEVIDVKNSGRELAYNVDTATGLSGGGILNKQGEIVAVHTRSATGKSPGGGRLIEGRALAWIKDKLQ